MTASAVLSAPPTPRPDVAPSVPASPEPHVPTAAQKRAQEPLLPALWSLDALRAHLPFLFPTTPDLPRSPKSRYRSFYRPPDPATLPEPATLERLTDFELALHLIDFSPLEPVLAQSYVPSRKGQIPFHPVSLFLGVCVRRELNLSWKQTATLLAGENGRGWRALCGFEPDATPSPSGLRYFFQTVGPQVFAELNPCFTTLLRQHHLFPTHSTFPGDPPDRGVTVAQDGMLHPARSRPSCQLATDTCYQPVPPTAPSPPPVSAGDSATGGREASPGQEADPPLSPTPRTVPADDALRPAETAHGRPCRARENGREGCGCDTPTCQAHCARASVLDPQARFIHYAGHNDKQGTTPSGSTAAESTGRPRTGRDVFGYRSVAERVLDDRFSLAWTAQSDLYPANADERTLFVDRVNALTGRFPDLPIGEWLDDAGVGYGECLDALWRLGALRMVDIRADKGDDDPEVCLRRGYDGQGCPLCAQGYRMRANGYDVERRRTKYVCAQVCRREPRRTGEGVAPVAECPYLESAHPLGQVVNVGRTLPDGSLRLAREIPYGSESWKARYGRRNLSESRNSQVEGLGLQRMQSYGLERNRKEVQSADFVVNLRTLGRLVRAATKVQTN